MPLPRFRLRTLMIAVAGGDRMCGNPEEQSARLPAWAKRRDGLQSGERSHEQKPPRTSIVGGKVSARLPPEIPSGARLACP